MSLFYPPTQSPAHPEEVTLKSLSGVGIGLIMKTLSDKNVKQAINYIRQMVRGFNSVHVQLSLSCSPPLPSLSSLLSSPLLKGANVQKAVRYIFRYTLQKQLRDTLVSCINSTCTDTCSLYNCTHVTANKQIQIFVHVYDFYYARNFLKFSSNE